MFNHADAVNRTVPFISCSVWYVITTNALSFSLHLLILTIAYLHLRQTEQHLYHPLDGVQYCASLKL